MRKIIFSLLAVSIGIFLTACAPQVSIESEVTSHVLEAPVAVEIVTYYCESPAQVLLDQIAVWNETIGAEQQIEIQVSSRCNCGRSLTDHLQQGDAWDLIDGGNDRSLLEQGWLKNLTQIDHPQIQALLDSYREDRLSNAAIVDTSITSIPKEACPIKLAVNLELFEKNGLALPTTWEDATEAARIITENGGGIEFGWGCCTWRNYFHHFILNGTKHAVGAGHWDPNTKEYSFSQYGPVIQALAQMYADGALLGFETMSLDEIRFQFASGHVAMLPALGYDFTVYTQQFPVNFDYTFIDLPVFDSTGTYSGVYLTNQGPSICAPLYDVASERHKQAVEEAWLFLNGDALNKTLYQHGYIIPCKQSLMEDSPLLFSAHAAQWLALSDLTRYTPVPDDPDSLLDLAAPSYDDVFSSVIRGEQPWTDACSADLETRYQAAYQQAVGWRD